jgi:hypothetical protein
MEKHRLTTELAASLLKCGWSIRLRVSGWSMKPLLKSGCLLRVAPLQETPQVGEIVLCRTKAERLVSHRVVAVSAGSMRTKGDACSQADGLVEPSQILGRVIAVEKPVFIPLTGRAARWTGKFLSRFYPKLVKMKMSVLEGKA